MIQLYVRYTDSCHILQALSLSPTTAGANKGCSPNAGAGSCVPAPLVVPKRRSSCSQSAQRSLAHHVVGCRQPLLVLPGVGSCGGSGEVVVRSEVCHCE